jgi:hypothetical protein
VELYKDNIKMDDTDIDCAQTEWFENFRIGLNGETRFNGAESLACNVRLFHGAQSFLRS